MRSSLLLVPCLLLAPACASQVQAWSTSEPSSLSPSAPPEAPSRRAMDARSAHEAFLGQWKGSLEYRDFQDDQRVRLPTTLDVALTRDGSALRFQYVYDDGPGKTVTEVSTVRIDPPDRRMFVTAEKDGVRRVYRFTDDADLSALRQYGRGVFTLLGDGEEKGQRVEVRLTLSLERDSLRMLRETRPPGVGFLFRHEYLFTRVR